MPTAPPARRAAPLKFSEGGGARIPGVEIFAAGEHRETPYAERDLDDIVANFNRHCTGPRPLMRVPVVIGHEEDTGRPAAAWVSRLYRAGRRLKADFEHVSPAAARQIKSKAYRNVSAEIYPKGHKFNGQSLGSHSLRRVALLGGEPPEVKGMAELPEPESYSERRFAPPPPTRLRFSRIQRAAGGSHVCFSEVMPMDEEAMKAALVEHGIDATALEGVPAAALAEMVRVCEEKDQANPPEQPAEEVPAEAPAEMPAEVPAEMPPPAPGEEKPADEFDEDEGPMDDPDEQTAQQYREKARKYLEGAKKYRAYCEPEEMKKFAEGQPDEEVSLQTGKPKAEMFSEKALRRIIREEISGGAKEASKYAEEARITGKKAAVDGIVERLSAAGRLPKAECECVRDRLMRADARQPVRKFSEKGKTVELSEFDLQVRELERRPSLFSERFKGPAKGRPVPGDGDEQVQAIKEHYESFSEQFDKVGMTAERLVAGFEAERARNRKLTADEYLGK